MGIEVKFNGLNKDFEVGAKSITYVPGENGATFTPNVSEDGIISWTNNKQLDNPSPINIKGPQGDQGAPGETPIKGQDYWTKEDKKEIKEEIFKDAVGQKTEQNGEIFGDYKHNKATDYYAHAEGSHTTAGWRSHTEGYMTYASSTSHAEGRLARADGKGSHAEGSEAYIEVKVNGIKVFTTEAVHIDSNSIAVSKDISSILQIGDIITLSPSDENAGFFATDCKKIIDITNNEPLLIYKSDFAYSFSGSEFVGDELSKIVSPGCYVSFDGGITKYLVVETEYGEESDMFFIRLDCPSDLSLDGRVSVYTSSTTITLDSIFRAENYYEGHNCPENGYIPSGAILKQAIITKALNVGSHAEGAGTNASGKYSHTEGYKTEANADCAHAEGNQSVASAPYTHTEGNQTNATNKGAHAEGYKTVSNGEYSHAEGNTTKALGNNSHSEGNQSKAFADSSHAEGYKTEAGVEGNSASGSTAHAEGNQTKAQGSGSHAENYMTQAIGKNSHAEGYYTKAIGEVSHAEGTNTIARKWQHVQGKYNIEDTDEVYAHIVGNGTSGTNRSNAHTLDWDGNAWFAGDVYTKDGKVVTGEEVDNKISEAFNEFDSPKEVYTIYIRADELIDGVAEFNEAGEVERFYSYVPNLTISFLESENTLKIYYLTGHYHYVDEENEGYGGIFVCNEDNSRFSWSNEYFTYIPPEEVKVPEDFYIIKDTERHIDNGHITNEMYDLIVEYWPKVCIYALSDSIENLMYMPTVHDISNNGYSFSSGQNIIQVYMEHENDHPVLTKSNLLTQKMNKNHPTGTGSLSLNRKSGTTTGTNSVAIGNENTASGLYSFAAGNNTQALKTGAFAEGVNSIACGGRSHAEGYGSKAYGWNSHAEGNGSIAGDANDENKGTNAHAEGYQTLAYDSNSHAEGYKTAAYGSAQHVQGRYNIHDTARKYAHIVGNGSEATPSNAHTIDWDGNAWFAGKVTAGANPVDNMDLVTLRYLNGIVGDIESALDHIIAIQESLIGGDAE